LSEKERSVLKVYIASDHGGFEMKEQLKGFIEGLGFQVVDFGAYSKDPVDYPDIAFLVAEKVSKEEGQGLGIIIDGAGIGSAITANKVPGVRASSCYDTYCARNSREHNDANVLTLGGRITGQGVAEEIVKTWLCTPFAGGRHSRRVDKMMAVERRFLNQPS
jgi:ribose 5-phosphate isomerase B